METLDKAKLNRALECEFTESSNAIRWIPVGILLAVSGGADSVAMLRCFAALAHSLTSHSSPSANSFGEIHVAHVNHGLRGDESDQDALFVRQLAETFRFPYHECQLNNTMFAADDSGSLEAAARRLRYKFLCRTAEQQALRYVAAAHNADDQTETILHRILRGTGIAGLAGIPSVRPLNDAVTLVRPMLRFSKTQILEYLTTLKQPFRTDSTNQESHFTRNKIRNELLPQLANEYNPSVANALRRLGEQVAEWKNYIASHTEKFFECATTVRTNQNKENGRRQVIVDLSLLCIQPRLLIREFFVELWKRQCWQLRNMTHKHWNLLADFVLNESKKCQQQMFPGKILVQRNKEQMMLCEN
ncbi:MAG: tRNA lysidine(34) synthetase TilS [Planctomycetaceae bacterium]|jgi:tRNA(Ile)-lysidine synthase|nr:tRNA lysidine(34) synthetase TilS [Planctomycetaceae bacterium]